MESVAPLAGAWIESLLALSGKPHGPRSPPSRGRGLKASGSWACRVRVNVAPLAGGVD